MMGQLSSGAEAQSLCRAAQRGQMVAGPGLEERGIGSPSLEGPGSGGLGLEEPGSGGPGLEGPGGRGLAGVRLPGAGSGGKAGLQPVCRVSGCAERWAL